MSRVILSVYDDIDNPYYGGGGARVVHEVARELSAHHEVLVLCSSYPGAPRRRVRQGVAYRYLPSGWAGPRAGQLVFSLLLPWFALRPFDVWFETLTPPFGVSVLPLLRPDRVVGWAQLLPGELMTARYRLPFARVERRGLRWYRRMIVLNDSDRAKVLAANPRAEVHVIPHGVRVPDSVPGGNGAYLLFLGRIDVFGKGLDLLLEARSRARRPLPLVIAGSGSQRDEAHLRALLPHDGSVRMVGRVEGAAKDSLLDGCAGLVMPSRVETFGLVALEAMARGKRVIAFDLPTLEWLAPSGHRSVTAFDVDELARSLDEFSTPTAPGADGRAREFAARFRWASVAEAYLRVASEVTSQRAAARSTVPRVQEPSHG